MRRQRQLSPIGEALELLRSGRPVLVVDDEDRENEGDVILAAEHATTEWVAWMVRYTSGFVCAPITEERADRLGLPLMVVDNQDSLRTSYTISVDARRGVGTGISAHDRALTARLLADPSTVASDLTRPGHVLPLRARAGGVRERNGHTEAAIDLCLLAGLEPAALIAELVHDDGEMMRLDGVLDLGARFGLPVVSIAQLVDWLDAREPVALVPVAR